MAEFEIKRAERSQSWLRLALAGASGAGKTWSGLVLAKGLVEALRAAGKLSGPLEGKIGVVDTERKSAQLYAHIVPFDVICMEPPYSPERYIKAIRALEAAGCAVIMVDQISHAWAGQGGVLEMADKSTNNSQGGLGKWADITPVQNQFVEDLLATNAHLIVTMRSKTEWVLEEYEEGGRIKKRPKRIGMAPVQRAGVEFEFTTLCNLDTDTNSARVLKDRTQVLPKDKAFVISEGHGAQFSTWLLSGAKMEDLPVVVPAIERATAVCESHIRMMEKATNIPDMTRIYHQGKTALTVFLEELPVDQVKPLLQRILDAGAKRKAELPNLAAATGTNGHFITPADLDQLENLMLQGAVDVVDLLEHLEVGRLVHIPHDQFDPACTFIINRAAMTKGLELKRPVRKVPEAVPVKPTAQQMVDEEAKRRGSMAPLLEMADDLPWKD